MVKTINDINTIYADMPTTIKAYTVNNPDGSYTIVLNSRLSSDQLRKSYQHEMGHIENGDYEKDLSVDLIEFHAHELPEFKVKCEQSKVTAEEIQIRIENFKDEQKKVQRRIRVYRNKLLKKKELIDSIRNYDPSFKKGEQENEDY